MRHRIATLIAAALVLALAAPVATVSAVLGKERPMRATRITMAAGAALVLSLLLASATLASGPSTSHRGLVTAVCGGETYNVAVENGGKNIGAAQVVDQFGHAILVYGTSTITDTTTGSVLDSWVSTHGSGHDNQTQTLCVTTIWYSADVAFGPVLPPGVQATDTILYEIDFWVILKV